MTSKCQTCRGSGEIPSSELYRGRRVSTWLICTACGATGVVDVPRPTVSADAVVTLVITRLDHQGRTIVFPAANARAVMQQWLRQRETIAVAWSVTATDGQRLTGRVPGPAANVVRIDRRHGTLTAA